MLNVSRRNLLGGAIGLVAFRGAAAAPPALAVTPVDRLDISFITDGAVFGFAEPVRRPDLAVERKGRGFADPQRTLKAEFGLSLAVRSWRGSEQRTVLVDTGYTPETFANNAELLGLDAAEIDALVISHGHMDHFGGLDALLRERRLRPKTILRVGGEEIFCARQRTTSGTILPFGSLNRQAAVAAGMLVDVAPAPKLLADHGFTTGGIPFVTNERPTVPTRMLPGQGCERSQLEPAKRDRDWVQDDASHELGLAYHVRGRGLVVIGSCSHRGILNTVRQAQAASGTDRVHAVLGGFHLVLPQTATQAEETARQMARLAPDYVVPGHCTGEVFIKAAEQLMPGRVIRPYVGSTFRFGRQS